MPFRSWVIAAALGLVALFIIALGGMVSWNLFSTYQVQHAYERQAASEYDSKSTQHSKQACGSIVDKFGILSGFACLSNDISADGSVKQAEYDLKAQQDMAEWAFGMLIITAWMTAITSLGVWFVWRTLVATQDTAKDTRKIGEAQVRESINSVAAAREATEIARGSVKEGIRPFVYVEPMESNFPEWKEGTCHLNWKIRIRNLGRSAATVKSVSVRNRPG